MASAAVLVVGAPAAAAASPAFHLLGHASGPAHSDGVRYAAWTTPGGRTVVLDTRTGGRTARATPGCGPPTQFGTPQAYATLDAVGSGFLMWDCFHNRWQDAYPIVAPIAGGPSVVAPGAHAIVPSPPADAPTIDFRAVGAQWLDAVVLGYHYTIDVALNWHTGQVVSNAPGDATQVAGLDAPGLARPLCAPLRRTLWPPDTDSTPPFYPMQYRQPFALTNSDGGRVLLERCGSPARLRVGQVSPVAQPQLGAEIVTLSGMRTVWAVDGRTGHRVAFHPLSGRGEFTAVHTRSLVLATVQRWTSKGVLIGIQRVLAAPLRFGRRPHAHG